MENIVNSLIENKDEIEIAIFNYFKDNPNPMKYDLTKIISDIVNGYYDESHIIFEWLELNKYVENTEHNNSWNYNMIISKKFERKIKLISINE
jgi:hypothetical protein